MISEISLAMVNGLTAIAKCHSSYPTQAEAIKQVADIYNRTSLTPFAKKVFSFWPALRRLELPVVLGQCKYRVQSALSRVFASFKKKPLPESEKE